MIVSLTSPLEAVLFAAGSNGCSLEELAHILQLSIGEVESVCKQLQSELDERESGLMLVEIADTWQLATRPDYVEYLRRMATSPVNTSISAAALETLAIVAYKQPITRSEIEAIRGVQSDRAVQTLVHRQLIVEVGRQDGPGRPILYGTTDHFLSTFGLRNVRDLPPLPPEPEDVNRDLSLFQLTPVVPKD
jgi:segregation and condensation protein B